ncbi:MAG: class I SAM-dependent methyltransferase [Nitrospirae bacterium]|nr:class I SAM-dependent methyltransferase [Nitrospirota bacterium]
MSYSVKLQTVSKNCDLLAIPDDKVRSVAIGIVRNESDIIGDWISHIMATFDSLLLVDHMSTDGTFEFLVEAASHFPEKVFIYRFDHPGYYQEEITNELAAIASCAFPNAWIMPMDADEFIEISGQKRFSDVVSYVDENRAISFPWRTVIPYNVGRDREFNVQSPFLFSPEVAHHSKCGIHAGMLQKDNIRFKQGNHTLNIEVEYVPVGDMLHVPIRSMDHLILKCVQGCIAYESIDKSRSRDMQGYHWYQMLKMVVNSGGINEDHLRDISCHYGQNGYKELNRLSIYDLIDRGWEIKSLPVKIERHDIKPVRTKTYIELIGELEDRIHEPQIRNMVVNYRKRNNWDSLSYSEVKINAIPDGYGGKVIEVADKDFLSEFITPAFQGIERFVPSAWSEHIPFLFCLLKYLRPCRFVELGTHFGGCFFAACQASKDMDNSVECIAIDTWEGDEHTGEYGEKVFDQFLYILNTDYKGCGRYIRKDFNAAASQFESGSIDFLHIDGLHTYGAVKHDYENWRSKLNGSGIIMFHDTHVLERGFGVYLLWNELRELYPSFCFEHGYGLGLIYVGSDRTSRAASLFKMMQREDTGNFLRRFFSLQGKSSAISTERKLRIRDIEEVINNKDVHIGNLEAAAKWKDDHIGNLEAAARWKDDHIKNLESHINNLEPWAKNIEAHAKDIEIALKDKDKYINDLDRHIINIESQVRNLEAAIRDKDVRIQNIESMLKEKETNLNNIYKSRGWNVLQFYYGLKGKILSR